MVVTAEIQCIFIKPSQSPQSKSVLKHVSHTHVSIGYNIKDIQISIYQQYKIYVYISN